MNIAAILVGGKGTRLRPALSAVPKPLAPVNGEPFLYLLLRKLAAASYNEVILLTGYGHEQIKNACGDGSQFHLQIHYSPETEPLGTGGALHNAKKYLANSADVLLLNGDTYLDCSLATLAKYQLQDDLLGVIGSIKPDDTKRYGTLEFDQNTQQIKAFREKDATISHGYVNAGIYKLSTQILNYIPAHQFVSLEQDTFPALLKQGYHLKALLLEGMFYDIGLPESYASFNVNAILNSNQLLPIAKRILMTLLQKGRFWLITENKQSELENTVTNVLNSCLALPDVASMLTVINLSEIAIVKNKITSKDCSFVIDNRDVCTSLHGMISSPIYGVSKLKNFSGGNDNVENVSAIELSNILQSVKLHWNYLVPTLKFLKTRENYATSI